MIKVKAPGMQRLFKRLRRYWVDDPEQMLSAVRSWWWDEGKLVFASQGGRVGSRWKRLTPAWSKRKKGGTINVLTGKLKRAMTGGLGQWSRIDKTKAAVGINYDAGAFNALGKWRPLTGVKPAQMAGLDNDMDAELRRFDRTL